jgi:uncharacterized protein (DUF2147 family)
MKSLLIIGLLFCVLLNKTQAQNEVVGKWLTENEKAKVEIFVSQGKYYGVIRTLKVPNDAEGKAKVDKNNPDESKRKEPLIGLLFLKGFTYDAKEKEWSGGTIYDSESGKTYKSKFWINSDGEIKLRGYWGIFYKTQIWKKA